MIREREVKGKEERFSLFLTLPLTERSFFGTFNSDVATTLKLFSLSHLLWIEVASSLLFHLRLLLRELLPPSSSLLDYRIHLLLHLKFFNSKNFGQQKRARLEILLNVLHTVMPLSSSVNNTKSVISLLYL